MSYTNAVEAVRRGAALLDEMSKTYFDITLEGWRDRLSAVELPDGILPFFFGGMLEARNELSLTHSEVESHGFRACWMFTSDELVQAWRDELGLDLKDEGFIYQNTTNKTLYARLIQSFSVTGKGSFVTIEHGSMVGEDFETGSLDDVVTHSAEEFEKYYQKFEPVKLQPGIYTAQSATGVLTYFLANHQWGELTLWRLSNGVSTTYGTLDVWQNKGYTDFKLAQLAGGESLKLN